MKPATALHHLTVNTGHVAVTGRANVDPEVINFLRPTIKAEGGPIPGPVTWALDIWPYAPGGAAAFQIAPADGYERPYVMCVACWRADADGAAREMLRESAGTLRGGALPPLPPVTEAPPVPWLAVITLAWLAELEPYAASMLGDLERCVFWALAEAGQ